jgi:hypothetical protein
MTTKPNFLIKAIWIVGTIILTVSLLAGVIRSKPDGLDKYEQWVRINLYPRTAARIGYYLETYIESPKWVLFRKGLFGNWYWIGLIALGIWRWTGKKTKSGKNKEFKSLKWMAIPVLTGLIIYTWQLGQVPPAVYTDEAVTGYNAFSVLMTGRDEYGQVMPVLFKYLGSWLPGLNIYLLAPLIKVLSLNAVTIRTQSVIFGLLLITVMYAGIRLKTGNGRTAFWGAAFFAITPWVFFYARTGYETLPGLMLFALGVILMERGSDKPGNARWGIAALILSAYMAHMFRYLLPFVLLGWILIYRNKLIFWPKKDWIKTAVVLLIFNLGNLWLVMTPAFWVKNQIYNNMGLGQIAENFMTQVKIYISPQIYFNQSPDIDLQHQIPGMGLLYWWMILPFLAGLALWIRNFRKNVWWWWVLLVGGIPAVMSGAFISTQRAVPLIIPMGIMIAEGMEFISKKIPNKLINISWTAVFIYSGLLLFRSYFVLMPGLNAEAWNYGYEQLAQVIKENPGTKIVIDNSRNPRNYILPLFYLSYPPAQYQKTSVLEIKGNYYYSGATLNDHSFGNLEFRGIVWKTDPCREEIVTGDGLAISEAQANEHKLIKLGEVKDRADKVLLQWYRTNPKEKCGITLSSSPS